MKLHKKQSDVAKSKARFKVIRAGRRSGKSTYEVESMLYKAMSKSGRNVFYISPNQRQSRQIIWEALKKRLAGAGEINESRLEAKVPTQDKGHSHIYLGGFENRENFRGQAADHITFDETDTMQNFFVGWEEIFKPALIDRQGTADFIGTPQKENPNLKRLEKFAEGKDDWATFHFTSWDNPILNRDELYKIESDMNKDTYKQEIMAQYIENSGALFRYTSLVDMFTNTVTKSGEQYLTVDIADDGSDETVFALWDDMECYDIIKHGRSNTESIINTIKELASSNRIPYSNIAVDAIGVGAGVASSSLLDGIIGFKSSHAAMRTDVDPVRLPNVHYSKDAPLISEYKNLRSQCIFELSRHVNNHDIACKVEDVRIKEALIEELQLYQDVSKGDGKRFATPKEDIKALLGHSPDVSDTFIMRCYFILREKLQPYQSEEMAHIYNEMEHQFAVAEANTHLNSTR